MTEQEKRAQFFAKTGRIATSELVEYQAFLWGMEYAEESLRQQLAERDKQVVMLREWIKQQGEVTNTCTFNIIREVCENCACHRNKVLAATEQEE